MIKSRDDTLLKNIRLFKKLVNKLTDRSLNNNGNRVQKYGDWWLSDGNIL